VKYLLTINGNVLPNNPKLVQHKSHHTHTITTWTTPKIAEMRWYTDSVANTSCRKLGAFPLKNYRCPEANPFQYFEC